MEFAVLEMIHKLSAQHDAIYGAAISDLQKKMEILPSALSRLLRGMEEKGLCVRSIDPKDRRSSYVSLTEAGQEYIDRFLAPLLAIEQYAVGQMEQACGDAVMKGLEIFCDAFRQQMDKEDAK